MALYVGLMSGTSLDGVDAVLAELSAETTQVLAHAHRGFAPALRTELLALNSPGDNELQRAALAANGLMATCADATQAVLQAAGVAATAVAAIGAHGQTVRHQPQAGYTLRLMNGALLAELAGIDVVCDFRSRDVAAGGQGAPLVPAFHAQRFAVTGVDVAVLNLGGIGNLTLLPASGTAGGFDCGPGNALLDLWCQQHRGQAYDADGAWAASGQVDSNLLAQWLAEPFFALPPPKSTGRELFSATWLQNRLPAGLAPVDVMATLAELTVRGAVDALQRLAPDTSRLLVCGGGAFNGHLMRRLAALLPAIQVASTAEAGVPPDQVEALAFAWLAWAFQNKRAGNLVEVTGARGPRLLGALYPA